MERVEKNENCVNTEKKKKKKKKKKCKVAVEQDINNVGIPLSEEKEGYCSVSDMLPRKVGEKTVFKDLEVTLTEGSQLSGISIPVTEKKKKEPEAAADYSSAIASFKKDTTRPQPDEQSNLANIVKLGSEPKQKPDVNTMLYNESHMDCSSTLEKNVGSVKEKQSSSGTVNEGTITKKKKKKKKKKSQKMKNLELPDPPSEVFEDQVNNPPTYVKLPGSGDNCVLLVSHESFGGSGVVVNQQVTSDITKANEQNDNPLKVKISAKPSSVSIVPTLSMTSNYNASNKDKLGETSLILKPVKISHEVPSSSMSCIESPSVPELGSSNFCANGDSKAPHIAEENVVNKITTMDFNRRSTFDSQIYELDKTSELLEESSGADPLVAEESLSAKRAASQKSVPQISKCGETPAPTKAQLRAERRMLQEKQRAAKLANINDKTKHQLPIEDNHAIKAPVTCKEKLLMADKKKTVSAAVQQPSKDEHSRSNHEKEKSRKVRLFSHLPQAKSLHHLLSQCQVDGITIHPAIVTIGAQYAQGIICGSNARCIALLSAFKEVIKDYVTPPKKELCRDLEANLQTYMQFLSSCRPLSISMVNAVKFLKYHITHVATDKSDEQAKELLLEHVAKFVREEIFLAKDAICSYTAGKIVDGDVILTYASSSLVREVLCFAFKEKKFRVIVVDSRPKMEGREMLRNLLRIGIPCSYVLINSISYVMKEVSKVIIGAHALQANGYVMSRVGCSQIALVASAYNVPVLVCCETYKFCERVYTDSFVYNELADPHCLIKTNHSQHVYLENWTDIPSLQILNLMYDVTSPDLVDMVITEKGMLPCTSVPVVLRVRHAGNHEQ